MATSFSGGGSWSTQREPTTLDKQLVNLITYGCESSVVGSLWVLQRSEEHTSDIAESGVKHQNSVQFNLKQWWSTIPPISTKWTTTSHHQSLNINKTMKYVVSILAGCLCVFKCILYLCTVVYIFGRVCLMGVFYNCIHILHIVYILGTYEVRNETKRDQREQGEVS